MIKPLFIVGIGSFFGGAMRYAISILMRSCYGQGFPWGTLMVNLSGCLVFGVLFALFTKAGSTHSSWCLLLTTGVCGGFTTFSTFANESLQMLQNGHWGSFLAYVFISVTAGICLTAIGYWIVK